MLQDGIMVVPGTTMEKVLKCFEHFFGVARIQKTPCDSGIQQQDMSQELGQLDSSRYRSIIGLLLYLSRDLVDIMFTVKELATSMSKPTLCSLQRLRRLMGYLKRTGDMGMRLGMPEYGKGKRKEGCEFQWLLETFTDADWASNKSHRKSTNCAIHFLNGSFIHASCRGLFHQQNRSCMQWFQVGVLVFSSKYVRSSFCHVPCSAFSGQTTALHANLWLDKALDAFAICQAKFCGSRTQFLLAKFKWVRCRYWSTSVTLEREV